MEKNRRLAVITGVVLSLGFFAGTAAPELLKMGSGDYAGFFSLYSFRKFEGTTPDSWAIFRYIAVVRLKTLLFLWMSVYTVAGLFFHLGYLLWLAASMGMLLSLFVLRDGYEGILMFFCCIFPQWLLYGAVWKRELQFFFRQWGKSGYRREETTAVPRQRELGELGQMAGVCLAGCGVEAYLGLWTLKIFLQLIK